MMKLPEEARGLVQRDEPADTVANFLHWRQLSGVCWNDLKAVACAVMGKSETEFEQIRKKWSVRLRTVAPGFAEMRKITTRARQARPADGLHRIDQSAMRRNSPGSGWRG